MNSQVTTTAQVTSINAASNISEANPVPIRSPNIRATKRKLDDAFQSLDDAVNPSEPLERPSPPKRANTIRSLYSTLAKYGIKTKDSNSSAATPAKNFGVLSKRTPHLTAILDRAASRTRKALPFKFSGLSSTPAPPLSPTAEYRPSSLPAFLSRLATFKLATYGNKPDAIDAVAAAKCGWINDGKDRLVCGLCSNSWVIAGKDGMSRDAANSLLEKQRLSLVGMHKDGCPWKARQCDSSIYRIPLQSPAAMVRDMKLNAITLEPRLKDVEVKHPLTSNQLKSLRSTISSFVLPSHVESSASDNGDADVFTSAPSEASGPSDAAILASLFGWALVSPLDIESSRKPSLSRATSVVHSVLSAPSTPSISRASSVSYQRPPSGAFTFKMPSAVSSKRDTSLLHCALCQRRVGLWAFIPQVIKPLPEVPSSDITGPTTSPTPTPPAALPPKRTQPQRQFDLLKEHRSYCPYVVRSTLLPSLPTPPPAATAPSTPVRGRSGSGSSVNQLNGQGGGALEGWRAVLTVVLRYGMGQRSRMGLDLIRSECVAVGESDPDEPMEIDDVKAMVAGVKSRGGKDLLKYVKGLLG